MPAIPHRLIVLTDISSLTPGVREPDDGQSMVRLMLYSNEIEIEGLIASSNMRHGQTTRPELIHSVVQAYGLAQPNLARHDSRYPAAANLAARVRAGQPIAGPEIPVFSSIGPGRDTDGSDWIIERLRKPDPRPLWVSVWGGTADLAQALWRTRQSFPQGDARSWMKRLRVHSIDDQDSTGVWLKAEFPELFYISRYSSHRGMYRGGDRSLCSSEWVERHIKGHGPLGNLYPNYVGGDIFGRHGVNGIKEGDTPGYLGLIANGLNPGADPAWGDWGGRCVPEDGNPYRWVDAVDPIPGYEQDPLPPMATVYRWRPDFQADFQARLDWCLASGDSPANHAPLANIAGESHRVVHPEDTLRLDASASADPDGRSLHFSWGIYSEAGTLSELNWFSSQDQPVFEFRIPPVDRPETMHVLLTLANDGDPVLKSYARVVLDILPGRG